MASNTSKVALPKEVVTTLIDKVKDTSTIAALSPSTPQRFSDTTYLVFNPTAEAEVVAEGAKKGSYDIDTKPIVEGRPWEPLRRGSGRGEPASPLGLRRHQRDVQFWTMRRA